MRRRAGALPVLAGAAFLVMSLPAAGAPVTAGMLEPDDVGIAVISKPHESSVIAYDLVEPDTCAPGESQERDGRVVSFAQEPKDPPGGAQLNEVVFDFASPAAAKAFFATVKANESARVTCGSTGNAVNLALTNGPKKVGSSRFTVTSDEQSNGKTRAVTSIVFVQGRHVGRLVFIDWADDLQPVTKIAKRASSALA